MPLKTALAVDMQRDYRFDLETQWNDYIEPLLKEQPWIIPATIVTIDDGVIGWKLHGWKPPAGEIIYEIERLADEN